MRLLHTADWHLGRIFYGTHLTEDQVHIIEHQLLPLVKDARIDAILLSGDVFDRSVPPVEAIELWDMFITKVSQELQVPMYVIAGNHDGPVRLEMGRELLAQSGVHIWGTPKHALMPLVTGDSYGEIAICPLPYREPRWIGHALSIEEGILDYDAMYSAWSEHLLSQCKGLRTVALCHGFVAGGTQSPSERPLTVGGSQNISPRSLQDFNYVALGHLHGPQRAGADHIRYSGSLMAYSFDEWQQEKSFTIVDMDKEGTVTLETVPIEMRHRVVVLSGTLQELLTDTRLQAQHKYDYVMARLLDTTPVIDGMAQLRQVYPKCMTMELAGRMTLASTGQLTSTYQYLDEEALFGQFAKAVWQKDLTPAQAQYMAEVWQAVRREDV